MAAASPWGEQILVGFNDKFDLNITALKNGTFVAVWSAIEGDTDIFAQIYDAAGIPIGEAFQVASTDLPGNDQRAPSVTALNDGGFAVAWTTSTNNGPTGIDVRARFFKPNGEPKGDDFPATQAL